MYSYRLIVIVVTVVQHIRGQEYKNASEFICKISVDIRYFTVIVESRPLFYLEFTQACSVAAMPVFFFWKEYVKGFYILKLRTRIRMCKLWRTRPDGQGILAMVLLLRQKPPKVWIPRFRPRRIHRTVGFLKSILAFEDISYWQRSHRYDGKKMKHQMVDAGIGMPVFFFESVCGKRIYSEADV